VDFEGNVVVLAAAIGGMLTVKFSPSGAEEWHRFYLDTTSLGSVPAALALDDSGNVCFTASRVAAGTNQYDFLTGKYRPNGDLAWAVRWDGRNWSDRPSDIAVDKSGGVYVTGFSDDTTTVHTLAMVKYDRYGTQQWAARTNRGGYDNGTAVALDSTGGIYVAGYSGPYSDQDYTVVAYREFNPDHDVGVVRVTAPYGMIPQGTVVTPACSTFNFGTYPESYRVRMSIGAVYQETAFVTNQQPATASYVTFPSWTANPVGVLAVTARTELGNDSNPANDVWFDSLTVGVPGVEERGEEPRPFLRLLSPNPQSGATARFACMMPSAAALGIFDASGREAAACRLPAGRGQQVVELDVRGLAQGVYFARLSGSGFTLTRRLILQR